MIASLLSRLFPPRLPSRLIDWEEPLDTLRVEECEITRPAEPKPYRDGIERFYAENAPAVSATQRQYQTQLTNTEEVMITTIQELIDQDYVNTIRDC